MTKLRRRLPVRPYPTLGEALKPLAIFHPYDPSKGPTPESVIHGLLQARNHCALLSATDQRKLVKLLNKTALAEDQALRLSALEFLGLQP